MMGLFDFSGVLAGWRWPGRSLESRESIKHGDLEWSFNRWTGLAFARCKNCRQIVRLRDHATMRPALVRVEFESDQWLAVRGLASHGRGGAR